MITYHNNVTNSKKAKRAYFKLKSVWSNESALRTWTNILILEKLEQIESLMKTNKRQRTKRKQSKYQIKLGKIMRENNVSIKDAHKLLKERLKDEKKQIINNTKT